MQPLNVPWEDSAPPSGAHSVKLVQFLKQEATETNRDWPAKNLGGILCTPEPSKALAQVVTFPFSILHPEISVNDLQSMKDQLKLEALVGKQSEPILLSNVQLWANTLKLVALVQFLKHLAGILLKLVQEETNPSKVVAYTQLSNKPEGIEEIPLFANV